MSSRSTLTGTPVKHAVSRDLRRRSLYLSRASSTFKKSLLFSPEMVEKFIPEHLPEIKEIDNPIVEQIFGKYDVEEVIRKSLLSLVQKNGEGTIISLTCLNEFPNVPSVPSWAWGRWLRTLYGLDYLHHENTCFIHLLVWDKRYNMFFLTPLIQTIFNRYPIIENLLLVVPPGIKHIPFQNQYCTRVVPKGYDNPLKVMTVMLMTKSSMSLSYRIRGAVEEDNDDLIPFIHKFSKALKDTYGDYYIAELLTVLKQTEKKIIVAEYNEYAVGVVIVSKTLNYDFLQDNFELSPFYGLRVPHFRYEYSFRLADSTVAESTDELKKKLSSVIRRTASGVSNKESLMFRRQSSTGNFIVQFRDEIIIRKEAGSSFSMTVGSSEDQDNQEALTQDDEDDYELADFSDSLLLELNQPSPVRRESVAPVDGETDSKDEMFSTYMLTYMEPESHLDRYSHKEGKKMIFKTPEDRVRRPSKFQGEENAFVVEVVATVPGHENAIVSLFQSAFDIYHEREFMVLSIPSYSPPESFLSYFVRVTPKADSCCPHELYVMHQNSVNSTMFVRTASRVDRQALEEFIGQMEDPGICMDLFYLSLDPEEDYLALMMLSNNCMVGYAVVSYTLDINYIFAHYDLNPWVDERTCVYGEVAKLEVVVLFPAFHRFARYFLREIHRLTDFNVLLYPLPAKELMEKTKPLLNVLQNMIPIMPRKIYEFSEKVTDDYVIPEFVTRNDRIFSLYLSRPAYCMRERVEINNKIVVIGAGDTALAFLEALLCTQNKHSFVTFTNITVVSPHGLVYGKPSNVIRDMMFVHTSSFDRRRAHLVSLKSHLNSVKGVLTDIDRREKRVIIDDSSYLPYDTLLLLSGEQYQIPQGLQKSRKKMDFPDNVFVINTDADAAQALNKLKELANKLPGKVLVYGNQLPAHCCLAALCEFGIPEEQLIYISPGQFPISKSTPVTHETLVYCNADIEQAVMNSIKQAGIQVHEKYKFIEWYLDYQTNCITSALFETSSQKLTLDCVALFLYLEKTTSVKTMLALSRAGIVFDGRIVIRDDCRTNDPHIYAAGSATKYSRRYYTKNKSHIFFSSEEVGKKLGMYIRNKLIPEKFVEREDLSKDPFPLKTDADQELTQRFDQPQVQYCQLPGGLYYLNITGPGKQIADEFEMTREDYGHMYVTGDYNNLSQQGYFRIRVDQYEKVQTISCLRKKAFNIQNLINVWGQHVKLLNNLTERFELKYIKDFFDYFDEPWACAIYHDRFPQLMKEIGDMIIKTEIATEYKINVLGDYLLDLYEKYNWTHLPKWENDSLMKAFMDSDIRVKVEDKILRYIQENDSQLPMYAYPTLIRYILHDFQKSPLFTQ